MRSPVNWTDIGRSVSNLEANWRCGVEWTERPDEEIIGAG